MGSTIVSHYENELTNTARDYCSMSHAFRNSNKILSLINVCILVPI